MITFVMRALAATVRQRMRGGPLLPGWSFSYELFARVFKVRSAALGKLPLAERRAQNERDGDREAKRLARQVERRREVLGGVDGEWFIPRDAAPALTVLYLHGGGFIEGSSRTHAEAIMRFAQAAKARAYAPNYRLAPEHKFPAQLEDVQRVYAALVESGVDPSQLIVMGDSAGGTLTVELLISLRDSGQPLPARAALLSPWTDLGERGGSLSANTRFDWAAPEDFDGWVRAYLPGQLDVRDPRVSPAYADLRGLPPLWIQVGTAEMLLDQVRAFAQRVKDAGVALEYRELPGMVHNAFLLAAYFPECRRSVEALGDWLRGAADHS